MRIIAITATTLTLCLGVAAPARAYVPEQTPARALAQDAARVTGVPQASGGTAAVYIARGGVQMLSVNGTAPMVPASVLKLATTTTAMLKLGPRARFATRVLAPARAGDVSALYLVGGGDPTLATDAYRRYRFLPKPTDQVKLPAFASGSPTVEQLASAVARAGVRTASSLVADESLFDTQRTLPGWIPAYTGFDPDSPYLSALTVNEGRTDLEGKHLVKNTALAAGEAFKAALADAGVRVGPVVIGRAPRDATEIARVESPPLAEIIDFTNRYSINFDAETILKDLGARFGGTGSASAGIAVVFKQMAALGIPMEGVRMYDASGLSLWDRMPAITLASILQVVLTARGPGWDALRGSIPVAGRPGTLQNRMTAAPLAGNLRGKTGQVRNVRCMAGWVTPADGVPLVYVVMFNGVASPFSLTGPLNLFGLLLAMFPNSV